MADKKPAREVVVNTRVTQAGLDAIDQARGSWTRSEYVRRAVAHAVKTGLKGPAEPEW